MERGDTGLGRDAYGPPRRERGRHSYGAEPYPSDDGYPAPAEEDDAAGAGRPVEVEDDGYGQLLRRPGEASPRQGHRPPGRPHPIPPGRFTPGAPPTSTPLPGVPGNGVPHGPAPHGGPARTTVAVAALPGDSLVEINCIAAVAHK